MITILGTPEYDGVIGHLPQNVDINKEGISIIIMYYYYHTWPAGVLVVVEDTHFILRTSLNIIRLYMTSTAPPYDLAVS